MTLRSALHIGSKQRCMTASGIPPVNMCYGALGDGRGSWIVLGLRGVLNYQSDSSGARRARTRLIQVHSSRCKLDLTLLHHNHATLHN